MEAKIDDLKKEFSLIIELCIQIGKTFSNVHENILKLKTTCQDFITLNNKNQIFVFCLDSLQFQCKVIDIEFDDMKRLLFALNNRMYCEYFKLYRLILEYMCKESILDLEKYEQTKEFPIYKDLEPFKQYKIDVTQDIHEYITTLLNKINEYICLKQTEFKKHQEKQERGFNMQNFTATFNDGILSIKQKNDLFISYLDFFHSMHLKYLRRLLTKICLFEMQLNTDIRLDEDMSSNINNSFAPSNGNVKEDELTKKDLYHKSNNIVDTIDVENISVEKSEDLQQTKGFRNIFKKNVKKILNAIKLFNSDKEIIEKTHEIESSSMAMDKITENIQLEINEATKTANDRMENSIQIIPDNTKNDSDIAINIVETKGIVENGNIEDKTETIITVKELLDNIVTENIANETITTEIEVKPKTKRKYKKKV